MKFKKNDRVVVDKTGNITLDSLGKGKVIKPVSGTASNPDWYEVKFDNGITKEVSGSNLRKESLTRLTKLHEKVVLKEALTQEFKKINEQRNKFNQQRKGVEIYDIQESPMVYGVNIAGRGTEDVRAAQSRVKNINEAIAICKKWNAMKIYPTE